MRITSQVCICCILICDVLRMVTVCASMLTRAKMYRGAVTEITRAGPAFSVRMEHEGSPDTVRAASDWPVYGDTRTNKRPVFLGGDIRHCSDSSAPHQ